MIEDIEDPINWISDPTDAITYALKPFTDKGVGAACWAFTQK